MQTWLLLFFVVAVTPMLAFAAKSSGSGSKRPFRLNLNLGVSRQDFAGVTGAEFSSISHFQYELGFFHKQVKWVNGVRYSAIPKVQIKPFVQQNGTTGEYKMDFTRIQYLGGYAFDAFRSLLILGQERIAWSGSPQLTAKVRQYYHYGLEVSYDLPLFGRDSRYNVPVTLTYLRHPARKFEFEEAPDEEIAVNAGSETNVKVGFNLDF